MAFPIDVFQKQRFVVSSLNGNNMPRYYVVISNIKWWLDNEKEIHSWMTDNLPRGSNHHSGMVISFEAEKDAAMFILKWS